MSHKHDINYPETVAHLGKKQFLWRMNTDAMATEKSDARFIEKAMSAIADPCRLSILQEISRKGSVCCGDVQGLTGLSQPTCSHHIKLLCDSKLLDCRKEGRNHYFTLNKVNFKRVNSFLEQLVKE